MSGLSGISSVSSSNSNVAVSPFHESFNTDTVDSKHHNPTATGLGKFTALQIEIIKACDKLSLTADKVRDSKGKNLAEFFELRKQISAAERGAYSKVWGVQEAIKYAKSVEAYYRPNARAAAQGLVDQLR